MDAQFDRSVRLLPPAVSVDDVQLRTPPVLGVDPPRSVLTVLMPLVMLAGTAGFVLISGGNTTSLLMGAMMAVSMIGMLITGAGRTSTSPGVIDLERIRYLRHLATVRSALGSATAAQRSSAVWTHPDPSSLIGLIRGPRVWERRPSDDDFCVLRIGVGTGPRAPRLVSPEPAADDEPEAVCAAAQQRFVTVHSTVTNLPITIAVQHVSVLQLIGAEAAGVVRSMLLQACIFHAPVDLRVVVLTSRSARPEWEWVKWLPHVQHPTTVDAIGPIRMISSSGDDLLLLLESFEPVRAGGRGTDAPQVLLICDRGSADDLVVPPGLRVCIIEISAAGTFVDLLDAVQVRCAEGQVEVLGVPGTAVRRGRADVTSVQLASAVGRALARRWTGADASVAGRSLNAPVGLAALLGLGDPGLFDPASCWQARSGSRRLRVAIGVGPDGGPIELDLKEAAQQGMGPHGLIIGATGSGKSEVLRTLVLGLASTHSPAALNFVLVDFKGGATFLGMQELPHVAAVITNLADDLTLVDRMRDALAGELNRRQQLLRDAGVSSVVDHDRAREGRPELMPLPALVVICDEFTELLTQKPDFAELFVAIGRLGRSLGIHLLLASQRLDEGKIRGLESHLSYRIGLKTFSAAESRAVLDVPDAYHLPPVPGSGYLKFDTGAPIRFSAAYVSGPYTAPTAPTRQSSLRVQAFSSHSMASRRGLGGEAAEAAVGAGAPSELEVLVRAMRGHGPVARRVWLPPLSDAPTLDQLLSMVGDAPRPLRVPLGLLDRPFEQRRDLLCADFSGSAGHGVVVGGPQSGKSNLLRVIVAGLALTHTPAEVHCYVVDLGGGSLLGLAGLPQVGDVATRAEPELIRRMVAEMLTTIGQREDWFRRLGIESMAAYRVDRRHRPAEPCPDVFLIIDGWAAFRAEFEELESAVLTLAQRGLSYGVHVVLSASRWAEIRPAMKDLLATRLELRVGDPAESEIDRRLAMTVPTGAPGRGVSPERLHFLAALPRIDGRSTAVGLSVAVDSLVASCRSGWSGAAAPRVRLLPDRLPSAALPGPDLDGRRDVPIGVSEATLSPVYLDFRTDPHLLVLGDAECGKTSFLRALVQQIIARNSPQQARFLVVDYRRSLGRAVPDEYLAGQAATATAATALVGDVVALLQGRSPGPQVSHEQLQNRSWWTGAELYVLVDDYDLVHGPSGNPLAALAEFLPQARDLGLHVVLARRAGGAARSMYEPVMQRLRELGSPGVLMSGPRDEGVLLGTLRPTQLPPGRGYLVSRRAGQQLVQLASCD